MVCTQMYKIEKESKKIHSEKKKLKKTWDMRSYSGRGERQYENYVKGGKYKNNKDSLHVNESLAASLTPQENGGTEKMFV